ncbi:MAG: Lrp/AsnC family transcriptional regulator [Thermoplasmata archaeon]
MDDLDEDILRSLNENARKSFREIARELDVSLSTVSNRVHRMEEKGVIKGYGPIVNAQEVGFDLEAVVGVRISKGKLIETQKKIAEDNRVFAVYDVTGDWDSVIMARFQDRGDLDRFIKKVLTMKYIERSNTQVVLNAVKDEKRVIL